MIAYGFHGIKWEKSFNAFKALVILSDFTWDALSKTDFDIQTSYGKIPLISLDCPLTRTQG